MGGEPLSSATFPGGRNWDVCLLEIAAPWNTLRGRVSRPISWGHWGETGTVYRGVRRSSPEGPALISPGPWAPGLLQPKSPIAATVLRPVSSPRKTRLTEPEPAQAGPKWDTLGRGFHTARWPTKGPSLSRLASGVIRAASSVSWNGTPAGESRTSCSRDPWRGGEPLSSATFPGRRNWDVCSLEIAAPWNTIRGRVSRPISWGHWGETGTEYRGVRSSSPAGPALISPGPWAPGLPQPKSPIEATVLRPASSSRKTRLVKPEPARQDPMNSIMKCL